MVLIILRVIVAQTKEEVVLSRLHELGNILCCVFYEVRIIGAGLSLLTNHWRI